MLEKEVHEGQVAQVTGIGATLVGRTDKPAMHCRDGAEANPGELFVGD